MSSFLERAAHNRKIRRAVLAATDVVGSVGILLHSPEAASQPPPAPPASTALVEIFTAEEAFVWTVTPLFPPGNIIPSNVILDTYSICFDTNNDGIGEQTLRTQAWSRKYDWEKISDIRTPIKCIPGQRHKFSNRTRIK